jgi:uncharacterized protein YbdZ (MbtH family)
MLVQMSTDEHATYFKTSGNTDDMPNVRVPLRLRGDDAAFSVTKAKTIPVAVTVVGNSRPDQELCLSFVANGVKLKVAKDWVLNGQEVRNETVDGAKATLVTLFVAIKYFEPPVTRVFVTARVKNSAAQKRLVLDVLQKVRDTAAAVPRTTAAPAVAAAATAVGAAATVSTAAAPAPAAVASTAVASTAVPTVRRQPSAAGSVQGAVTLATGSLERALDNDTHVFFLSHAAKASSLVGWNIRLPKAASTGANEPAFAVKLGTPFPVRVLVGDNTTQLSVALTADGKKLKNGRDWRLHSQTRKGEGADTELLLDIIVANAACDVPVLISAGASGDKLGRSTLLLQLLPTNTEAPVSPRGRATTTTASPTVPRARTDTTTAAAPPSSPPPVGRARTATASAAMPLPAGWAEAHTTDGRTYYYNKALNKTTWVRPTASNDAGAAAPSTTNTLFGGGTVDNEESSSDDDATPLPPDWRAATNSAGRLYYFNVKTKATSWSRPPPPAKSTGTEYTSSDVLFEDKPVVPRLPLENAAPAEPADDDDDDDDNAMMPALAAGPQSLSDDEDDEDLSDDDLKGPSFMTLDWTEKVSELSESFDGSRSDDGDDVADGTKFSVMPAAINNRFDTWVGGAEKSSDDEASDEGVVHEPAKVVSGTSGATMTAAAVEAATRATPQPTSTTATSTAKPAAAAAAVVEAADTGAPPGKQIKAGWKMALSSSSKRYWYNRESGETSWVFPAEGESVVPNLPPGWKQATSSSGQTYFYNSTTKETRWTRPIALQSSGTPAQPISAAKAVATPSDDSLPSGWKQAVSAKNNRVYYFAPATGETSWTKPTAPVNTALPKGWRQAKSAKGEVYYFNSKGVTRWTMPTQADAEQ